MYGGGANHIAAAQSEIEESVEPFLPRPPSENASKRQTGSDMWPSPPSSPSNAALGSPRREADCDGAYDRDGVRIPRKPAPQPPNMPNQGGVPMIVNPNSQFINDPQRDSGMGTIGLGRHVGANTGMTRQFSADNILQETSLQPIMHPNSNYMSGFATTGRVTRMQNDGGFIPGSNVSSLTRNPILFPNPDRFGTARKSLQDLLNDNTIEEAEDYDKRYCSDNVGRIFSVLYFIIVLCVGCNVFCWHLWRPLLVLEVYLNMFCFVIIVIALVSLIYLFCYYRSLSKISATGKSVTTKDERQCNNLLKLSIPVFGFVAILGCTVRLVPHLIALIASGCLMESLLPATHFFVLIVFFLLLIYFLIINSKTQISKPKLIARSAIMHVCLGLLSFLALETVANVKLRVPSWNNDPNSTTTMLELVDSSSNAAGNSSYAQEINSTHGQFSLSSLPEDINRVAFNLDQLKNCTDGSFVVVKFIRIDQVIYPYVYIAFVHFTFISIAFLVLLWTNMNRKFGSRNFRRRQLGPGYLSYGFSQKSKVVSCRRTSVGLVCGSVNLSVTLSLLMYTIAFTSLDASGATSSEEKTWNLALFGVHNVYALIILTTLCLSLLKCWFSLSKHESKPWSHSVVDQPLLVTSILFVILYDLAAIYSAVGRHFFDMQPHFESNFHTYLSILTSICNILQAIAQVVFLFDALRRVPIRQHRQLQQFSNSRGSVLSMSLLNLSLWMLNVIQFITLSPAVTSSGHETSESGISDWMIPTGVQPGRAHMFFSVQHHARSFVWTMAMLVSSAFAIFFRFVSTSSLLNVCQYSYD